MKISIHTQVRKSAIYSVIINALQILAMLIVTGAILLNGIQPLLGTLAGTALVIVLALIVIWGAAMDIREAVIAGNLSREYTDLGTTVEQMNELNIAMRAQRHDFLNHLQVVYSLMEMEEYNEARDYISRLYGDIQSLSKSLKTRCTPVNALMRVKLEECAKRGIQAELLVRGAWAELPIPGWEMCRVLGNLIDNAMDAMKETENARLTITLGENVDQYYFEVANNGPVIPEEKAARIFEAGFSSKGEGRGMGLYISRNIMREGGGDLLLSAPDGMTAFRGTLPKSARLEAEAHNGDHH